MNIYQTTIKAPVSLKGVGLHTGQEVNMVFKPAAAKHGVKFQRVDLEGAPVIPADCDLVVSVDRGTTLEKSGAQVSTVEHAMAAIAGLEIDNLLIELDGPEIPIMDGSSMPFIEVLEQAGIENLEEEREIFELEESMHFKDEEKNVEMLALPAERFRVTTMIDYGSQVLGHQKASMDHIGDFKVQFADARTFCFLHELEMLLKAGLIKGGDLDNAVVVVDRVLDQSELDKLGELFGRKDVKVEQEGILNNVQLRHKNEPARHKLLDVVGDLALVGTPIKANIIATRPGHKTNVEFAQQLKAHIKKQKRKVNVPKYDPNEAPIYDLPQIEKMLPHRYPFLLVDKIIELSDDHIVGVKNVTFNEQFFTGHFPGNPVMPGVLQIEAMAQTGGLLVMGTVEDPENYDTYFLRIDSARFKRKVVPGDTLIFKLEKVGPIRRGICEMKATAFVGNQLATEAMLVASIVRRPGK